VIEVGLDIADDTSYALRVRGQSMVEDLIADGDIVIIRPGSTASNGDTVVALITSGSSEKGEATLKRFYREGNLVRLQPANQTMEPIYVRSEDLLVQGKVVALIRRI
jgi:repressor LexA